MGTAVVSGVKSAYSGTKNTVFKYFGSMMMEPHKDGEQEVMSYTRALGVIMLFSCLLIWHGVIATNADGSPGAVPAGMLNTLWGLILVKGGKDIAKVIKGK